MAVVSTTTPFPFEKTVEHVPNDPGLLSYLDDADTAEALAYGYGIPPASVLAELRFRWWRQRRQGLRLPAERRVILIAGGPV